MKKNQNRRIVTLLLIGLIGCYGLGQTAEVFSVGFYNLENLFDPQDDPTTFDEDYTPMGRKQWTEGILKQKIDHLAKAIHQIGFRESQRPPLLLGVAEVENFRVLKMLTQHELLYPYGYEILHFDSPDARGIDLAMLYQKDFFLVAESKTYSLPLFDGKTNQKRTTRDQLVVSGWMEEEELHLLINHWPSRRGGQKRSESNRISAARLQQKIIDSLQGLNANAKIIVMGDFNDNPDDQSLRLLTEKKENSYLKNFQPLFNPMRILHKKGVGSLAYRDRWFLFDQILISHSLMPTKGIFFIEAKVFGPDFLKNKKGKYKGYPFRSEIHGDQLEGYSDHFPIYGVMGKTK